MRDWLGAEDSPSCGDAVRGVCRSQCMLYSVYAVLGVTSCSWHGEIESDHLTSCSLVMVELRLKQRDMRGFIMRNWDFREFRARDNVLWPKRQVHLPIRCVITPIQRLPNPIGQVVSLISHICSYPAHHSYLHPHLSLFCPRLNHHRRTHS